LFGGKFRVFGSGLTRSACAVRSVAVARSSGLEGFVIEKGDFARAPLVKECAKTPVG